MFLTRLPYSAMKEQRFLNDILPLKDKLFRMALHITLNRAEAEDVVQDTFIKVWERSDEWDRIESMEAFCMTICRNRALDKKGLAHQSDVELKENIDSPLVARDPLTELTEKQQVDTVRKLVEQLPEAWRTIMLLRETEGKSYQEIAQVMGISESQVKVNMHRARLLIKEQYKKIDEYGL